MGSVGAPLCATAFLTAFYMGRVLVLTFLGKPSPAAAHAHESPPAMTIPLVALGIPTVVGGLLGPWLARGLGGEMHLHLGLTPVLASSRRTGRPGALAGSPTCAAARRPLAGTVAALDRASSWTASGRSATGTCSFRSAGVFAGWTATWWTGS